MMARDEASHMPGAEQIPTTVLDRARDVVGRSWVLAQVEDWRAAGHERFLMITGKPGSGKTMLAAWLAGVGPAPANPSEARLLDELRRCWDAVHFCVARGQGTLDPSQFTQSLIEQLSRRYDVFAEAVIDRLAPEVNIRQEVRQNWGTVIGARVERLIVSGERRAADLYQRGVREPLRTLAAAHPDLSLLILVDALDEAVTASEPNIVTLLAGSTDLPPGVRFVVTSRDERRVLDSFGDARRIDISSATNAAATDEDITAYVTQRLGTQAEELSTAIVDRAEGNFLYVAWVLDELSARGVRQPGAIALPKGLYGLYREFLDRLVKTPSGFAEAWRGSHEPFFGLLTVADPAAPEAALPKWLGWDAPTFNTHTYAVTQVIEYLGDVADGEAGFRLYHRSVAEFFDAKRYRDNGGVRLNEYHIDPDQQHERIAAYYLRRHADPDDWDGDWSQADRYGLSHLVGHLAARVDLADDGRRPRLKALYAVSLAPGFHAAQRERFGGVHATLADLRTTLEIALRTPTGRDLVAGLRAVIVHRSFTAVGSLSEAVFGAVAANDVASALRKAEHYRVGRPTNGWEQILLVFLAHEAAENGQDTVALDAVRHSDRLVSHALGPLLEALLIRVGVGLATATRTAEEWLADIGGGSIPGHLFDEYGRRPQHSPTAVTHIVEKVEPMIRRLEQNTEQGSAEASSVLDPETSAELAWSLRNQLYEVAGHPDGQNLIERAVRALAKNPYPRYRDLALAAVGTAVLGSSDRLWVRRSMQAVLRAGLDDEGVTFTFDLPSVLLAEARRRGRPAPQLAAYLDQAERRQDVWGTSMRALSAAAAAAFHRGEIDGDEAIALLIDASAEPTTYAGYGALATLSLIDRCHEFGEPHRSAEPRWGPSRDRSLPDLARHFAERVYDPGLREERIGLVGEHLGWSTDPPPEPAALTRTLATLSHADERSAYLTHLSARWAAPSAPPDALRRTTSLVPLVLFDSTALDAVLGRLFVVTGPRIDDEDFDEIVELTGAHLTTGRPWTLGQWR